MTRERDATVVEGLRGRDVARVFGELLGRAFVLAIAVGLLLIVAAAALPAPLGPAPETCSPEEATSGCFPMRRDGADPWAPAPTLSTEVRYRIFGLVGRATVTQSFRNGTDVFVEGVHVFPLPEQAAVDHLRMRVGERWGPATSPGTPWPRSSRKPTRSPAAGRGQSAGGPERPRQRTFASRGRRQM